MSVVSNLSVTPRDRVGKGGARATRRTGLVPGVIYGNRIDPVSVAMDPKILLVEMRKKGFMTRLFDLDLDGKKERCLCRGVQKHPVTDRPVHVDFMRVGPESRVHIRVPVHFTNQELSPGLKRGGVLNIVLHEIEVTALAASIPDVLNVSLEGLEIGHSLHFEALHLPEGVTVAAGGQRSTQTIATIVAPTVQTADPTVAAAAPAAAAGAAPAKGGAAPAKAAPAKS